MNHHTITTPHGGTFHLWHLDAETPTPLQVLRYHVTGAIERGEAEAIVAIDAPVTEGAQEKQTALF